MNRPDLRAAAAVMAALHLGDPRPEALATLGDADWEETLQFCDRSRLTLPLGERAGDRMPGWVRERTGADFAKHGQRRARLMELYTSLRGRLGAEGIEFATLKGPAQSALSGIPPEIRVQYDADLYVPGGRILAAREVLLGLGYESLTELEDFPTDHLPPLVLKTGWEWRGDFFDPEIPIALELHYQFWDMETERLAAPGVEAFWDRRTMRTVSGVMLPVLAPVDCLGYAALHLLKHLLRGSVTPFHVYELAHMLERQAADEDFWRDWERLHAPGLRRLEAVSFELAHAWFGCELALAAEEAIERLPPSVLSWFGMFAAAPLVQQQQANKHELWLHLSLLESAGDRWRVARRRILPARLPGPVDAVYVPESGMTLGRRWRKRIRYGRFVVSRVSHHAAALPRTLGSGASWWLRASGPGSQFWTFLGAAALFNFALFVFVLLYNLRLLELGFREDFLGVVSGSNTVGCVAGAIPAALLARRLGLRNALLVSFAGTAAITGLRAVVTAPAPLVVLSFAAGLVFALWAVLIAPLIAQLVDEKRRPAAFSIFFGAMIAIGTAGGWVGGRLPLWVHGKEAALLVAAGMVALAILPGLRLQPLAGAPRDERVYPRGPFLTKFLAAFALWNLATGAFNPFFNAYFARLHFSVERIGSVFSGAQLIQTGTVLLAPWILKRAGLVGGITWMMAATALALGGLASQPAGSAAVLAYMGYMAFQWMSEPGMNTLLMNHVEERQRGGASALMYLVAFSAQAAAAFGAGALVPRAGYGMVLAGAAILAALAAAVMWALLGATEKTARPQRLPAPAAASARE